MKFRKFLGSTAKALWIYRCGFQNNATWATEAIPPQEMAPRKNARSKRRSTFNRVRA